MKRIAIDALHLAFLIVGLVWWADFGQYVLAGLVLYGWVDYRAHQSAVEDFMLALTAEQAAGARPPPTEPE